MHRRAENRPDCKRKFFVADGQSAAMRDWEALGRPHCGKIAGKIKAAVVVITEKIEGE